MDSKGFKIIFKDEESLKGRLIRDNSTHDFFQFIASSHLDRIFIEEGAKIAPHPMAMIKFIQLHAKVRRVVSPTFKEFTRAQLMGTEPCY
jgi:hypothetical protein